MASRPEKMLYVLAFHERKPIMTVQRQFRRKYKRDRPSKSSILGLDKRFVNSRCVWKGISPGRPISEKRVENIRQSFSCNPEQASVVYSVVPPLFMPKEPLHCLNRFSFMKI
jgi:hypothetical protein